MEGKSLPTLKSQALAVLILALLALSNVEIQAQPWPMYSGSFLEPTQFTLVKSAIDRTLRLQMGYGGDLLGSETFRVGTEGLVWSRLRVLSDFRFPVETADYFFGLYSRFSLFDFEFSRPWRLRLSHISSHIVDGSPDTVVGGSSSHYSREFVTVERLFSFTIGSIPIKASGGVRYVFHQIEHSEASLQVPATVEIDLLPVFANSNGPGLRGMLVGVSTADDPSGSSISVSFTLRSSMLQSTFTDLFFTWRHGPSLSGNFTSTISDQFEVGLRIEPSF